ncbi:HAMP domain-containing sensor histidine kinase [Domibacillus sp. DTU_2020_1001157_1_SI_ALB_TIR_016]|uniref:HAMP domain-containing sensor histidine kinase n=1 Tax=Domibacillus sp. DTU_2020_1001157_1_SI_ALB_TIR_016 TaxID=3077789 RepID=UPI0028ECD9E8|nr:HAMP domain-containing sensor histidine kinase [Domibacillus sp. DTU_2020_1001157_1_SI_ALB_TIR_016]WNS81717.1 HAMP domain-containing sensor histidine kinase [Domibacillus sp. DTU_2020_1001157_1_SI_ALB_TIR_016]
MNTYFNLKRIYYIGMGFVIAAMITGLLWGNPHFHQMDSTFMMHVLLVALVSLCLLMYPAFRNRVMKTVLISAAIAYFYTIFFLYPDTWSTFIYICLIPAISILFFDPKLFYLTLFMNTAAITSIVSYVMITQKGGLYVLIKQDLIGNMINFFGSQIILCLLFYLTYLRIKKQRLYYEQIQQAERIKTAGQLAAAVAHEIRNPLTVVKGFLQLYEQDSSYNEEAKKHFALMIDELDTAEEVISQFLTLSAPSKEISMEKIKVKESLYNVVGLLHSYGLLHANRIELEAEEECTIAANQMEFKQLCINLIKNAIEASEDGHSVLVRAKQVKHNVEISIIDHGKGMSEMEIQSLGTPFYSLKSKGTGLGLMICFNIVKKYKGTIRFQSVKEKGTTVTLQFPLYEEMM